MVWVWSSWSEGRGWKMIDTCDFDVSQGGLGTCQTHHQRAHVHLQETGGPCVQCMLHNYL